MKNKKRDYFIIVFIVLISVLIFLYRKEITEIGEWGYLGVFLLCALSNLTVLLPAPSLMVVVSFSRILNPVLVSIIGAVGTTIGELSGFAFGNSVSNISEKAEKLMAKISKYIKSQELLVFIFALLPLPLFDFAGMFAGGNRMPVLRFLLSCYLGKLLKMLFYATVVATVIDRYL